MPTSASCPPPTEPRITRMRGFSLLEMLVVLVILGMAAALVAPSLSRTADRVRAAGDRDDVRRLVQALPMRVREAAAPAHWPAGEAIRLPRRDWPEGWQVVATTPFGIAANGWCSAAVLTVSGPGTTMLFDVAEPDCRVSERDDAR